VPQQQLLRLFPQPAVKLSAEEVYADLDLPPGEAGRPYTVINAVGTLDGRGAVGGKSTPVGSEIDHRLMRNIRSNVDAVLVGAGTLRSEDLTLTVDEPLTKRRRESGLKEQPLSVLLTESGDVPAGRKIFQANEGDLLVFAGARASQDNLAKLSKLAPVRTTTDNTFVPEPKKILKTLADEFGVSHLLVEGGPSVNRSFLEALLVDEVFITLAPKIVGGDPRSLVDGEPLPQGTTLPSLVSVYLSDSELYLRYLLARRSGPASSTSFR
jgi:2,5-diamino-6-(ribosylamino)-4(3H)-pyrimidinone 5'-phosphate reductase